MSAIAAQEPRLNDEITTRECRLIDFDGNQMGVYPTHQAQQIADDMNLDLVEIAPNATPPVCRIMDYGKFKYDQAIKAKQARKNQNKIEVKEMKFRPKIDVGDYTTKKKHVLRFLEAGNKVKITIMFRGREMAQPRAGPLHSRTIGRRPEGRCRHREPAEDGGAQHAHAHRASARDREKEKGFQERRRKGQLMPKMKTHRGMAKRVRKTGTGKLMRAKAFKSHILTKKSPKRKRNFRHETEVAKADTKVVERQLGLR